MAECFRKGGVYVKKRNFEFKECWDISAGFEKIAMLNGCKSIGSNLNSISLISNSYAIIYIIFFIITENKLQIEKLSSLKLINLYQNAFLVFVPITGFMSIMQKEMMQIISNCVLADGGNVMFTLRNKFTLVELLVVIAIIAILAGMIMPVLSDAISNAKKIDCTNNLRQVGTALAMYSSNTYYGRMPDRGPVESLYDGGNGLIGDINLFICPEDSSIDSNNVGVGSYQRNGTDDATGLALGWKPNVIIAGDGDNGDTASTANHQAESFIFLFKDGHCISHRGDGNNVSATSVKGASGPEDVYDTNITSNSDTNKSWLGLRE